MMPRQFQSPAWFADADSDVMPRAHVHRYVGLFLFFALVMTVLYVHRVQPVFHKVIVNETTKTILPAEIALTETVKTYEPAREIIVLEATSRELIDVGASRLDWTAARQALTTALAGSELLKYSEIRETRGYLELEFPTAAIFGPGRVNLVGRSRDEIKKLGATLSPYLKDGKEIFVEGYTDDYPVINRKNIYPTNWELSAHRAAAVVKAFTDGGVDPEKMRVVGFGETRAKHPNRNPAGEDIYPNRVANRRVVIRVGRP